MLLNFEKVDHHQNGLCIKEDHDNNKISFICLYEDCPVIDRLGCAYCFLELHQSHLSYKMKLSIFEEKINDKLSILNSLLIDIKDEEEDSSIIKYIEDDFQSLKSDFLHNIALIQENLIDFYCKKLKKSTIQKENLEKLLLSLKKVSQTSLLKMNVKEIELSLEVLNDKGLEQKPKEWMKEFWEQHQRVKEGIYSYLKDFKRDFESFFQKLNDNHGVSSLNEILKRNTIKEPSKINEKSKVNSLKNSFYSNKISKINEEISKPILKTHKIPINELLKKNAKGFFEIFLYNSCEHLKKTRLALIFPCCNKAFLCIKCHDKDNNHKWDLRRDLEIGYCLKCYMIIRYKDEKCKNCLIGLKI